MEGINKNYEESKASNQILNFETLELKLKKLVGIDKLSLDILKILNYMMLMDIIILLVNC